MIAISAHLGLAVHGAADLRFRIIGKTYLLGDDNPNRIPPYRRRSLTLIFNRRP